jgi:protein phosphatase PTC7
VAKCDLPNIHNDSQRVPLSTSGSNSDSSRLVLSNSFAASEHDQQYEWSNAAEKLDDKIKATSTPSSLRFEARGVSIPHPKKSNNGEDAFYNSNCGASMGVADGVGGWALHGIDAGLYARDLMQVARKLVEVDGETNPCTLLSIAYEAATASGSSTACIASLQSNRLRVTNLGDSGLLVLRQHTTNKECPQDKIGTTWKCVLETRAQQHYFNCPVQLGKESEDQPKDADNYEMEIAENDLIIMASDGLFDNVSTSALCEWLNAMDVASYLRVNRDGNLSDAIHKVAHRLVLHTAAVAGNPLADTPFACQAKHEGVHFKGGKEDDITVLIGMAVVNGNGFAVPTFGDRVALVLHDTEDMLANVIATTFSTT